jgi:hypothetical protein
MRSVRGGESGGTLRNGKRSTRDIHGRHPRTPFGEQQRILAEPTAHIEQPLAPYVT